MNAAKTNSAIEAFIRKRVDDGKSDPKKLSGKDLEFISQYTGAGGKAQSGARGEGLLHEFYTPSWLCKCMWNLAKHHGYNPKSKGAILDPSAGTGRFLEDSPVDTPTYAFEINPYAAFVLQAQFPHATVYNQHFETAFLTPDRFSTPYTQSTTWLDGYPFSLVITNPPYGKYGGRYASYFQKTKFKQFESFFIYHSLRLLKPGGLLVMVIPSSFLRNGSTYQREKALIGEMSELIDAYRLPEVFDSTSIPTDIIVLKKKAP